MNYIEKILIIALMSLILPSLPLLAHTDLIYSLNKGNVHLRYLSGWGEFEVGNRMKIFVEIANKLLKDKFSNSEQLYIYFGHDYTQGDTSYYTLGYSEFSFQDYTKYNSSKSIQAKGIKIIIRDRDFDIKKVLLLVNAAFLNIDFVKKNQSDHIVKSRYKEPDTIKSIPFSQVNKYLSNADTTIDMLLNKKYYRNLKKTIGYRNIDYYFQNNQFHFYNTIEQEGWQQKDQKANIDKKSDKDILIVDNIHEIVGNNDHYGHFVFINDSVFYFLPELQEKVYGPIKIDSIVAGRPPIRKYYCENETIEKYALFIDNYNMGQNKVLYIPQNNLLIPNYNNIEDDFIRTLSKKQNNENTPNKSSNIVAILLAFLCSSIIIILWLIIQRKKQLPIKPKFSTNPNTQYEKEIPIAGSNGNTDATNK